MNTSDKTQHLAELRRTRIPKGVFNITPYFAQSAKGAMITDVEGNEFIDFAGGIGVMNVGHNHPLVVAAIKEQADRLIHSCFHVMMYEPYIELADLLCGKIPGDFPKMAMLANSGAEAVENAVKAARHYTQRAGVIAFDCAFHGRTLMGLSLTSKVKPYKLGFGPFAPEVYRMPYAYCYRCPLGQSYPACDAACADYLEDFFINHAAPESVACLVVEPVAGEGGFVVPPREYFTKLAEICRKYGIIFIDDEIQSGMARTGRFLAIEHWGVTPDLVTVAKSLAAGMPLSGVVGRADVLDAPQVGGLGGTYGGNPVACAAALAALSVIDQENLYARSEELGQKVRAVFEDWQRKYQVIGEVRGLGSMLALELVKDRETREPAADEAKGLVKFAYERGLVLLSCGNYGNVVRILMPLVIDDESLEKGLAIMEEGLAAIAV
jgi:4-aminobutyrate aminotransferase/(S)-3-amino-2-methylpropionate transaminase